LRINLNFPCVISTNVTSSNYSFSLTSDLRYQPFNNVFGGSGQDYSKFEAAFDQFKVVSTAFIVTRVAQVLSGTEILPALYCACDPNTTTPANPINNNILWGDNSHIVAPTIYSTEAVTWRFPGVGTAANIWYPTNSTAYGAFYIGCNTNAGLMPMVNLPAFDVSLVCEVIFTNSGGH
jgi:hypothetical protein